MSFTTLLNKTLAVWRLTQTGTDPGGQPIYSDAQIGTLAGRIDPRVQPVEMNGPDLNPVIADYLAITELGDVHERDYVVDENGAYDVLGVATLDGLSDAHHLEINLRKVSP
jgi:hypothetical protein